MSLFLNYKSKLRNAKRTAAEAVRSVTLSMSNTILKNLDTSNTEESEDHTTSSSERTGWSTQSASVSPIAEPTGQRHIPRVEITRTPARYQSPH